MRSSLQLWFVYSFKTRMHASYSNHYSLVNGNLQSVELRNLSSEDVASKLKGMVRLSGLNTFKVKKLVLTKNPTTQGNWHPFLNK